MTCKNREATCFIAVSQPGAGMALDIVPDGTWDTRIESAALVTWLQRRGAAAGSTSQRPGRCMMHLMLMRRSGSLSTASGRRARQRR